MIKRTLCASIFSLSLLNTVYALDLDSSKRSPNELVVAIDGQTYFGVNKPFFQGTKLPDGYEIIIRCFKSKSNIDSYVDEFGEKWNAEKAKAMDAKEVLPDSAWEEFEKYCEDKLDMKDFKDYPPETAFDTFIKDGYLPSFRSYWALKTPDGELIPAMWMLDPNHEALTKVGKNGDKTPILVWKNPEYKEPEATTCKAGEGNTADENKAIAITETTKEIVVEGNGFSQKFQIVATAEQVAAVPGGLAEIAKRVVSLFNDMPKVAATIIGRMVIDNDLAMCPIFTKIGEETFKASLVFAADTVPEDAKKLAEHLEEMFSVLKKQVLEENKDSIDAEHNRRMEEHKQKLAYHEARAAEAAKKDADVSVDGFNAQSQAVDHMGNPVVNSEDKELKAKLNQQGLLEGIKGLQGDVDGAIGALKEHENDNANANDHQQPIAVY